MGVESLNFITLCWNLWTRLELYLYQLEDLPHAEPKHRRHFNHFTDEMPTSSLRKEKIVIINS